MQSVFSQQLISDCITVGVAARNYFQLQLQPRSLLGIIFQFRLQPRSQVLWAHNLWELMCASFRHSAGLHARVILDGVTCRLWELGDVRDVLSVLGVW